MMPPRLHWTSWLRQVTSRKGPGRVRGDTCNWTPLDVAGGPFMKSSRGILRPKWKKSFYHLFVTGLIVSHETEQRPACITDWSIAAKKNIICNILSKWLFSVNFTYDLFQENSCVFGCQNIDATLLLPRVADFKWSTLLLRPSSQWMLADKSMQVLWTWVVHSIYIASAHCGLLGRLCLDRSEMTWIRTHRRIMSMQSAIRVNGWYV